MKTSSFLEKDLNPYDRSTKHMKTSAFHTKTSVSYEIVFDSYEPIQHEGEFDQANAVDR